MGCAGCSTGKDGKPAGCQSNGGCSSGGCNKFNVYNWLADFPLSDYGVPYDVVEVSFQNGGRKEYFRNVNQLPLEKGMWVTVEAANGYDVGAVSLTGELVKLQLKKYKVQDDDQIKRILRVSTDTEVEQLRKARAREKETLTRARAIVASLNIDMKVTEIEFQADEKKVTIFYTAQERVDFRELIKVYAGEFRSKIEMRQIGARQESAKLGGIGSCGRELCCSTWLVDFKSVNTTAARYQNLSINQTKLSGQCGRLKCCLNFELDTYMDALKNFPKKADVIYLKQGKAYLQKKDIFRNLMWYSFEGSNKQYPLTIDRVNEILALNEKKVYPEELEFVEIRSYRQGKATVTDMGFVNDVGQISLQSLDKGRKGRKSRKGRGDRAKASNSKRIQSRGRAQAQATSSERGRNKGGQQGQQQSQQGQSRQGRGQGRQGNAKRRNPQSNQAKGRPNNNNKES